MEKTTTFKFTIHIINSLIYGCNNTKIKKALEDVKLIFKNNNKTKKEWIAKESLTKYITNNSFGYRDNGFNVLDADNLLKELEKENKK